MGEDINKNPFILPEITNDNIGNSFDKEERNLGDIVCVTDLYDELIQRFGSYDNAKKVYEFAKSLINKSNYSIYGNGESIPYLNFTIYLEQDLIDCGLLSAYAEEWIPGKRYHIGDIVYYSLDGSENNIKTYILVSGETSFSEYYSGFYDETKTKLTFFDEINDNGKIIVDEKGNLKHWKLNISDNVSGDNYEYSNVHGVTESLLKNVTRKKSDMDVNGNTLPFILHYIEDSGIRTLDSGTTEMFYMLGFTNTKYNTDTDKVVCDCLYSITFYNSTTEEDIKTYTVLYNLNKTLLISLYEGEVSVSNSDTSQKTKLTDCDMVRITYYIGSTMIYNDDNEKWHIDIKTGVKYVEIRPITKKIETFLIEDGENIISCDLPYIQIESNKELYYDYNNIDLISSMRDVNYANITVNKEETSKDYFLKTNSFKDEALMNIQDASKVIDVKIERGIAESFQKHNMFGEICTLQDLENYKNGKYLK